MSQLPRGRLCGRAGVVKTQLDNGDNTHERCTRARYKACRRHQYPSEFEGEIREFIRRDVAHLRRTPNEGAEQAVNGIHSLLDRVSGSSVTEIDSLIADLHNVREFLKSEGERVQREIASYAQLSRSR